MTVENMYYIYTLTCRCGKVYVGSTGNFDKRLYYHHRSLVYPDQHYHRKLYKHIRECSSWDQIDKKIIYTGFGTENERAKAERWYQIEYNSVFDGLNHSWATKDMTKKQYIKWYHEVYAGTVKQYREDNKEVKARYDKQYREDNKEAIASYKKQYSEDNKEAIASYQKQYYEDNKEALSSYRSTKIPCDICGTLVSIGNMARHKKTQKCINFVKH